MNYVKIMLKMLFFFAVMHEQYLSQASDTEKYFKKIHSKGKIMYTQDNSHNTFAEILRKKLDFHSYGTILHPIALN